MNQSKHIWVCNVSVATVWTNPASPREIDQPGLKNPVDIKNWYKQLTNEKRLELCDHNLVQTQLLFGEKVIVENAEGNWAKIIAVKQVSSKDPRGYPGWVPIKQLKKVKQTEWNTPTIALIKSKTATLYDLNQSPLFDLSYLTMLPVLNEHSTFVRVRTPKDEALLRREDVQILSDIPIGNGKQIVTCGEQYLGLPYFWGGMSAFGYDCSGFAYNMHKANGYIIPRDASDQAKFGVQVPFDDLQIGDLVFFAKGNKSIHHVGIYYGDGKMIHSPSTGKGIEIISINGTKYEKELCEARRYYQKARVSS